MIRLPKTGELIDNRFGIKGICSTDGGMGVVYFVEDKSSNCDVQDVPLVLKYCKAPDEGSIKRFKREVRILSEFNGNNKIAQIVDLNIDHDPPYYVMKYYKDGDLTTLIPELEASHEFQETTFLQMCDCIAELHDTDIYHRDIKPQNFLRSGDSLVVSDLGLSMEKESLTAFTTTSDAWGTQGYSPPEYMKGGFKNADARFDVFMLGKSFYVLLTKRDPLYLLPDDVHPAIFSVIERCCAMNPDTRYQEIHEVKQAIVAAYDVILKRVEADVKCRQQLDSITERLEKVGECTSEDINEFIDTLCVLEHDDQEYICKDIKPNLFRVVAQEPFKHRHDEFIVIYDRMVRNSPYHWSFAETIAHCALHIFNSIYTSPKVKAAALDMAIYAAERQNRFAAMDRCREMITGVVSDDDAVAVRDVLQKHSGTFIINIEPVSCKNFMIGSMIRSLKKMKDE